MTNQCDVPELDVLDTSGLYCPEPVMLLHKAVRQSTPGQQIKVIATDPSTERDIPKFCYFLGHQLQEKTVADGVYTYLIGIKPE